MTGVSTSTVPRSPRHPPATPSPSPVTRPTCVARSGCGTTPSPGSQPCWPPRSGARRRRLRRPLRPPPRPRHHDRSGRRHLPARRPGAGRRRRPALLRGRVRPGRARRDPPRPGRGRPLLRPPRPPRRRRHRPDLGRHRPLHATDRGHEWLAGLLPVPLADGGALASGTWERVRARHLAPEEFRVRPLLPWTPNPEAPAARTELPALLRGYLRPGAWVAANPAHDPRLRRRRPSTSCCRCAGSTRATCGTSSPLSRPDEHLAAHRALHPGRLRGAGPGRRGRTPAPCCG